MRLIIFVETIMHFCFQDSVMNRKLWNKNIGFITSIYFCITILGYRQSTCVQSTLLVLR